MSTNVYGFYSLTLPSRPTELQCTFIGYAPATRKLIGSKNVEWNVSLSPQSVEVDAAEVVGTTGQNTEAPPSARLRWPWRPSNACLL